MERDLARVNVKLSPWETGKSSLLTSRVSLVCCEEVEEATTRATLSYFPVSTLSMVKMSSNREVDISMIPFLLVKKDVKKYCVDFSHIEKQ